MATLMEKDVLLEYASIGHLQPDDEKIQEFDADSRKLGSLWHEIMCADPKDIDFKATVEEIKSIRQKYEK